MEGLGRIVLALMTAVVSAAQHFGSAAMNAMKACRGTHDAEKHLPIGAPFRKLAQLALNIRIGGRLIDAFP